MGRKNFSFSSKDGLSIFTRAYFPQSGEGKAIVQIAHGMAEHGKRYERFAEYLNAHGFIVYVNDHRGHGRSCLDPRCQGYMGDSDGFLLLIEDMAKLAKMIRKEHPSLPLFLFGHSMGSFASQRFLMDYPKLLDGLILSGSNGSQGFILSIGKILANLEASLRGNKVPSKFLNALSFGSYNKAFEPSRTPFDWLTRSSYEVDQYLEDPFCGEVFPASFYRDFFESLQYIEDKRNFQKIPKNKPLFLISGSMDPVGQFSKGVYELYARYKKLGLRKLSMKIYPEARHELLNEINKDVVMEDIVDFLNSYL